MHLDIGTGSFSRKVSKFQYLVIGRYGNKVNFIWWCQIYSCIKPQFRIKIFLLKYNDSFFIFHEKRKKDKFFFQKTIWSGGAGANATNFDIGAQQVGFSIPKKASLNFFVNQNVAAGILINYATEADFKHLELVDVAILLKKQANIEISHS